MNEFNGNDSPTLGVEIELQLIDRETGELANRIGDFLDRVPADWQDFFKPEFMQSYCEINTGVCQTVADIDCDLAEKLDWANEEAEKMGLRFIWSGAHPFSRWESQQLTPGDRYAWLADTMQDVARRLVVFGLHIHVGVNSGDKAIQMCDRLLRHLPTLLALSANSPMWCGRDTGMASYRSKIMEALPTAGLPQTLRNWSEYTWLVKQLMETGFIRSRREIWWDVRPHARFGTVELRIMDQPLKMRHLLGLAALSQSPRGQPGPRVPWEGPASSVSVDRTILPANLAGGVRALPGPLPRPRVDCGDGPHAQLGSTAGGHVPSRGAPWARARLQASAPLRLRDPGRGSHCSGVGADRQPP